MPASNDRLPDFTAWPRPWIVYYPGRDLALCLCCPDAQKTEIATERGRDVHYYLGRKIKTPARYERFIEVHSRCGHFGVIDGGDS